MVAKVDALVDSMGDDRKQTCTGVMSEKKTLMHYNSIIHRKPPMNLNDKLKQERDWTNRFTVQRFTGIVC